MPATARPVPVGGQPPDQRAGAELNVPLFHRHARGLILTEQGELLYRTAHDVFMKLQRRAPNSTDEPKEKPTGELSITTTVGLGSIWLTPRLERIPRALSARSR